MITKKEIAIAKLARQIIPSAWIRCDQCNKKAEVFSPVEIEAAGRFYKKGWREFRETVYCPPCAKKHFKKPKK